MGARQLEVAVIAGIAAIILGLHPGIAGGIQRARSLFESDHLPEVPAGRLPGQIGFAIAGACLILLALYNYLAT